MNSDKVRPEDSSWPDEWEPLLDGKGFVAELKKELNPGNILSGIEVTALARRVANDDVIFELKNTNLPSHQFALVHLTWSGKKEAYSNFPFTRIHSSLEEVFKDAAE